MKLKKNLLIACMILSVIFVSGINTDSVSAANETEGNTTSVMRGEVPGLYKCIASDVNIRSGPGTDYDVVGTLNYGDLVYVVSLDRGWAKLAGGALRYVKADYLAETRT